jgi:hypothetical protein
MRKFTLLFTLLKAVGVSCGILYSHQVVNLTGPKSLGSISHDDVMDKQGCKALTVLFAADSNEYGNVGTRTGPSFFQALAAEIGGRRRIAVQGIDYPVDYHEYR